MMLLQKDEDKSAKKVLGKRFPWQKEGSMRYVDRIMRMILEEVRDLKRLEKHRWNEFKSRTESMMSSAADPDYVRDVVCGDEGDVALLDYLLAAGNKGITPTEASAAGELRRFKFQPYHVTRRVQRMNKRLQEELGKNFAETYSRRWQLTSYVVQSFGYEMETEEEDSFG